MNKYKRKLVSFCVWGNSDLYNLGLLENAIQMPKVFPGWIMHISYTPTANQKIINELSSLDINPDFVLYCVIKTMKNGEINENFAKQFVLKIYDLSLEHPEYITIEFQHKIVDLAVDASQKHNDDLITSLQMIINQLSKGLKEGGKSKKSKSKKYNRKSRGKKHKRSKSKKIRKS